MTVHQKEEVSMSNQNQKPDQMSQDPKSGQKPGQQNQGGKKPDDKSAQHTQSGAGHKDQSHQK